MEVEVVGWDSRLESRSNDMVGDGEGGSGAGAGVEGGVGRMGGSGEEMAQAW